MELIKKALREGDMTMLVLVITTMLKDNFEEKLSENTKNGHEAYPAASEAYLSTVYLSYDMCDLVDVELRHSLFGPTISEALKMIWRSNIALSKTATC